MTRWPFFFSPVVNVSSSFECKSKITFPAGVVRWVPPGYELYFCVVFSGTEFGSAGAPGTLARAAARLAEVVAGSPPPFVVLASSAGGVVEGEASSLVVFVIFDFRSFFLFFLLSFRDRIFERFFLRFFLLCDSSFSAFTKAMRKGRIRVEFVLLCFRSVVLVEGLFITVLGWQRFEIDL